MDIKLTELHLMKNSEEMLQMTLDSLEYFVSPCSIFPLIEFNATMMWTLINIQ